MAKIPTEELDEMTDQEKAKAPVSIPPFNPQRWPDGRPITLLDIRKAIPRLSHEEAEAAVAEVETRRIQYEQHRHMAIVNECRGLINDLRLQQAKLRKGAEIKKQAAVDRQDKTRV